MTVKLHTTFRINSSQEVHHTELFPAAWRPFGEALASFPSLILSVTSEFTGRAGNQRFLSAAENIHQFEQKNLHIKHFYSFGCSTLRNETTEVQVFHSVRFCSLFISTLVFDCSLLQSHRFRTIQQDTDPKHTVSETFYVQTMKVLCVWPGWGHTLGRQPTANEQEMKLAAVQRSIRGDTSVCWKSTLCLLQFTQNTLSRRMQVFSSAHVEELQPLSQNPDPLVFITARNHWEHVSLLMFIFSIKHKAAQSFKSWPLIQ